MLTDYTSKNYFLKNKKYKMTFFQQQVPLPLPCYDFTQANVLHS